MKVLVGIPEEKSGRKKGSVSNAQLMYIHTHGSEVQGIPPRPVIEPAIEAKGNKEQITEELAASARALMDGDSAGGKRHLSAAGMIGQNVARDWFEDPRNGWAPNTLETAKRKLNKLTGKNKQRLNDQISAGKSMTNADVSRPLIDTGQLRKSISYVVEVGK